MERRISTHGLLKSIPIENVPFLCSTTSFRGVEHRTSRLNPADARRGIKEIRKAFELRMEIYLFHRSAHRCISVNDL